MVVRQVDEAIRDAEQLIARGAGYDEVMAALDACASLPGAEEFMQGIRGTRLTAMLFYRRDDEELRQGLREYLELDVPLYDRAWKVISTCSESSKLAQSYLPPLIAELETALSAAHDEPLVKTLESARKVCARLGVDVG